jgi:hypothetical protein
VVDVSYEGLKSEELVACCLLSRVSFHSIPFHSMGSMNIPSELESDPHGIWNFPPHWKMLIPLLIWVN